MGFNGLQFAEVEQRLHSWKEIAAYLGRGVRTVQRWEAERGLPVHRAPGGKIGSIYAVKSELTQWMEGAKELSLSPCPDDAAERTQAPEPTLHLADLPSPSSPTAAVPLLPSRTSAAVVALCILFVIAGVLAAYRTRGERVDASATQSVRRHTASPEAVSLYEQGRSYWQKRTPADLERAVDFFTQAIVQDPQYAEAFSGMADCYNLLREFSSMPPQEAYPRAIAAATRAVQLDDGSAEAHTSLAFGMLYWKWDWETAEHEFLRGIELNPSSATAHHWYANALMSRGRATDALREIDRAEQLDPGSLAILGSKGLILISAGRQDEGRALLQRIEASNPEWEPAHDYLSQYWLARRDARRFLAEETSLAGLTQSSTQRALILSGRRGFAAGGYNEMLRAMLGAMAREPDTLRDPYLQARFYALLGKRSQALDLLTLAYGQHRPGISFLANDQTLVSLHDDARFQRMAQFRQPFAPPGPIGATQLAALVRPLAIPPR